jgi:hypothetical protein
MLRQVGGLAVRGLQAFQVLAGPAAVVAEAHLGDGLLLGRGR